MLFAGLIIKQLNPSNCDPVYSSPLVYKNSYGKVREVYIVKHMPQRHDLPPRCCKFESTGLQRFYQRPSGYYEEAGVFAPVPINSQWGLLSTSNTVMLLSRYSEGEALPNDKVINFGNIEVVPASLFHSPGDCLTASACAVRVQKMEQALNDARSRPSQTLAVELISLKPDPKAYYATFSPISGIDSERK